MSACSTTWEAVLQNEEVACIWFECLQAAHRSLVVHPIVTTPVQTIQMLGSSLLCALGTAMGSGLFWLYVVVKHFE